jgi:hypothetical protein
MRRFLSLLMGQGECASSLELRKQYQKIITALMAAQVECTPDQVRRYETAIQRLTVAFEKAKNQLNNSEISGSVTGSGVLLGEILIDAGVITQRQLEDALQTQAKLKPPLPIGRILVARNLITWEQLAYYLKLQDLLQLDTTHKNRLARQMLELGLASKTEIELAELDCDTTNKPLLHIIERRGWASSAILGILTGSECIAKTSVPPPVQPQTSATPRKQLVNSASFLG